ncbi:unnamed protein product [Lactuca virosa]|uniref:HECT-type E3 ubiquitin transferase n=1 Tax=Lactuca virosa TaxID=75947 RepID=A0AAU9M957_9ASTR|nr:unnamed protein product [Lactuca virosa]
MSSPDSPSVDFLHQRIKRKFEDYDDDEYDDLSYDLPAFRMRKDDPNPNSPPATASSNPFLDQITRQHPHFQTRASTSSSSSTQDSAFLWYPDRIQFFVRMISESKTLVLHGKPDDKVKLIHEKIQAATGIPMVEQRLIYRGRQLQWDYSLAECKINNDAGLHLVGRMRSTEHPQAWQLIDDLVSTIYRLCKGEKGLCLKSVKSRLTEFLNMTAKYDIGDDQPAPHLNIFQSLCAPAALMMLYMSPHAGNKECAQESIRHLLTSSKDTLSRPIYSQCAPIALEFCKLLCRVSGRSDPLYEDCRSSLGSMVEYLRIGRSSRNYDNSSNKPVIITVQDILPYVAELANNLTEGLISSVEAIDDVCPSPSDVLEFASFLRPLKAAIKDQTEFEGIIPIPKSYLATEKKGYFGWDSYLSILKELRSISKLYQGAEDFFWENLKRNKVSICYLIVKYAKRGEDYKWILGHKDLIDFESRRHLVLMLLPEMKDEYDELHEMLIDRSQLLAESFEYIARVDPETLRGGLFMEFKNEEATGPGVLREWFFLVSQEIFNPQNALFVACPNDRRRFFPNPASKVDPLHLEYFNFAGRIIALALMHKIQVGIAFDRSFFSQLSGNTISLEDIKDADPYLYSSCKQILDMDPTTVDEDALGLTFIREIEELGSRKVVELFADGKNIVVNSRNRKEYVDLLIEHRFVTSVSEQVSYFAKGFTDIAGDEKIRKLFFKSLECEDLDGMLYGSESIISVEDWKKHTEYYGYKETDPQISWLWEIIEEMTGNQRKVLLFFWTSLKHLPIEGFGGLASKLYIYKTNDSIELLPSSHTCFYRICFPSYPSLDIMRERLNIITQDHVGCSFGTW